MELILTQNYSLGVTQVNTLLGIPFEKFWLMFSLNNLKVHHKQNMFINILTEKVT